MLKSFELSATSVSANPVQQTQYQLYAQNFIPAEASHTVRWSSDNPEVATVDPDTGMVQLLKSGSANVTATATDGSGVQRTCHFECVSEYE